jgi:hypothetical protein
MFRFLTGPTTWEAVKWLAYVAFLILPGSLAVLALLWLVRSHRARRLASPALESEQYLAEATDLSDLERRMRVLERASGGPAFVTFNH